MIFSFANSGIFPPAMASCIHPSAAANDNSEVSCDEMKVFSLDNPPIFATFLSGMTDP